MSTCKKWGKKSLIIVKDCCNAIKKQLITSCAQKQNGMPEMQ